MLKLLRRKNRRGMTLTEIMVVAIIIGILCAMAVPSFSKYRDSVYKDQCITNLRIIAAAKEHWSLETGVADTATPTSVQLDPYIKDGTASLFCPNDPAKTFATSYNINNVSTNPTCKIETSTHVLP